MGSVPLINTYCRTFIRVFRQTLENDHGAYYKKKNDSVVVSLSSSTESYIPAQYNLKSDDVNNTIYVLFTSSLFNY